MESFDYAILCFRNIKIFLQRILFIKCQKHFAESSSHVYKMLKNNLYTQVKNIKFSVNINVFICKFPLLFAYLVVIQATKSRGALFFLQKRLKKEKNMAERR